MRKYFASIFVFLVPILRRVIIEIAADELSRVAYPDRPRRRMRDTQKGTGRTEIIDPDEVRFDFKGPRPACQAIDSLADDLGDHIVDLINVTSMRPEDRDRLKESIEDHLTAVFTGEKVHAVRNYIYQLNRALENGLER